MLNGTADSPAKLSSGCGQFWKGIEIHGDPLLPQTSQNQGQVDINNGIIEKAICGIRTGNTDYTPEGGGQGVPSPVRPSGGIINAQDATFRNNIIGIEFHPYRDGLQDNESHLHECTFITDDALFNEAIPQALLKLDGINNLEVLGCEFRNSREMNGLVSYDQRGKGIFCYNSEAYLNSKSTSDCKFEQLERGVYALHSGLGHSSISIANTHFLSNQYGIYVCGFQETNPVTITNNTFSYLHNISNSIQYGIYFDNSSGYKVELNTLSGSYFAGGTQYGILINNSGVRTNYIYNNDFSNLKFALQSQNLNRGFYCPDNGSTGPEPGPETGLCFKCNNFIDCVNDIIVAADDEETNHESGIVKFQGHDLGRYSPTAKTEPAGNLFSSLIPQQHLFDINMGDVISHSIIYTHHVDDQYYHLIPEILNHVNNPDLVVVSRHSSDNAVYYPDPNNGSCPDDFPTENVDSLITIIHQAKDNIDSIITLLSLFVDDGDTEEKNSMVLNSEPDQAMEIYADLINTSPYLSDTVLSSSASKEEVLSNSMITDIMAANPQSAKNELILTALEERVNPLTEAMWSEVLGGIDTLAAREILESSLAGWIQLKEYCINNLIRIYLTDSITQWNPDSCRRLLSNDHVLSSQFSLVSHLLDNGCTSSADSLLNAIQYEYPLSYEEDSIREQFLTLNPILDILLVDSIGNVMPDSIQQLVLEQLSLRNHTIPGAYARNILIASGMLNYMEPILSPSELKSSRRFRPQGKSEELADRFKIYPNPCKSYLLIEIEDITQDLPDEVAIYSINNRLIYRSSISSFQHVSTVPMENIESGVYLLQLLQSGKVIESKKILHIN